MEYLIHTFAAYFYIKKSKKMWRMLEYIKLIYIYKKKAIWNFFKKTFKNLEKIKIFFRSNYKKYKNTKYLYLQGIKPIYGSYM